MTGEASMGLNRKGKDMKHLLIILTLLAGLSHAGEEPDQIYLYIVMNGERNKIEILRDKHDAIESCERAVSESKQNHARAVVIFGRELKKRKADGA